MASKTPPPRSARSDAGSANTLRVETERLLAKERYKDAVKQAKLAYKEAATPENHRLLERAYFLRARQLVQHGMRSSAIEVAQHLIDFGVTDVDAPEELIRLLAGLGFEKAALAIQDRVGRPGLKEQISQTVADQLVLHPDRAGAASVELVREARLIRQALEKLQAGDEAGALEGMRDLARSSPLSEWKLLVRGLAAFQRGDEAESRANWDRLDPDRASARISRRLRGLADDASGPSLAAAEKLAFGEPLLDRIRLLAGYVAAQEWDKAIPQIGPLRAILHRIDPKLTERLTVVLIGSIIKGVQDMDPHEAQGLVSRFTRTAQPMAIDPRWNRLWAMIWDGPHAEASGAIHYWTDYVRDLESVPSLSPTERTMAQALVWNHVAGLHRIEVDELSDVDGAPEFLQPRRRKGTTRGAAREDPELVKARKSVVAALEKSLHLAPEHVEPYQMLVDVYHEWGDERALAEAGKRLLAKFPDDVETLELFARHHNTLKDPRAALPFVEKARRLKPLDDSLRTLEWIIRVGLARQLALEAKWDEGRAQYAAAEALGSEQCREFTYLARKAIFELKAGQAEQGDRYVQEATKTVVEPAPLWLSLAIESIRFEMSRADVERYTKLWEAEKKKKPRSETAGAIARLLYAFIAAKTEYPGREAHVKQAVAYLERSARLKYRREDIEDVANFLRGLLPEHPKLYQKLVRAAIKQHPGSAVLHMHAADVEMQNAKTNMSRGLHGIVPAGARQHLQTALKLAEGSSDAKLAALLPEIRRMLGSLDEISQMIDHFAAFGGPFGPGFMDSLDFDPDDDFDDDFDEDDPFVLDPGPAPARPARKAAARPGGKKRGGRKK